MLKNKSKDELTKELIISKAELLFKKWGFFKTTMEEIAKESGKAKSTLYHYYKNKSEVFDAIFHTKLNEVISKVEAKVNKKENADEKMKEFIIAEFLELQNEVNLYSILVKELKENNKILNSILDWHSQRENEIVLKIIKNGIENNIFRKLSEEDSIIVAEQIVIINRNLQIAAFTEKDSKINEKKILVITDLFLNGIIK